MLFYENHDLSPTDSVVDDKSNIGLINPHPKGKGGDHSLQPSLCPGPEKPYGPHLLFR